MLGSLADADDAVQEAWMRLSRADTTDVANLGGWLTTVVGRVCLDMLRSRKSRREDPLDLHLPDPIVTSANRIDPEQEVLLADSVGLALLVVLQTLAPAERLAFVLHDMFAVPFEEIALVVDRSPASARQLASRARRRVRGSAAVPEIDLAKQREVVDAFLTAARGGDFEALVAVLDPDVVLRADTGALPGITTRVLHGAAAVASQALMFSRMARSTSLPVLVNGSAGVVSSSGGAALAVMGFTIVDGKIVEIHILADPERVGHLDLTVLGG
jgi:RNA polymerase sigma-70 factor (ECF subfamily)